MTVIFNFLMALLKLRKRFEGKEDLLETNESMTTVSKTIPVSPCSDCSAPNSARSDWFRQSVLFWSSQSERSGDECTNDRYCRCHTSESLASSQMSLLSNISPRSNKSCKSPKVSKKTTSKGGVFPCSPAPASADDNEEIEKSRQHKVIEYDPSDLLKQVEELERCFQKTTPGTPEPSNDGGTSSPYLTLEFPTGSSIKKSPLYSKQKLRQRRNQVEDEDERKNTDIIQTIQSVQNTLREISREIEQSSKEDSPVYVDETTTENTQTNLEGESENDTLLKIAKTNEDAKNDARDPNMVMQSLLSNIKPPPPNPNPDGANKDGVCNSNKGGGSDNTSRVDKNNKNSKTRRKSSQPDNNNHMVDTDELFLKIDQLIQFQEDTEGKNEGELSKREKNEERLKKYRDRLDSGLQSTSSDSNSPTHSPGVTRALGQTKPERRYSYNNGGFYNNKTPFVIHEVSNEKSDSVFRDDSDFCDCSPVSTLAPAPQNNHRPRSQSVSYSHINRPRIDPEFRIGVGNMTDTKLAPAETQTRTGSLELEHLHDEHEAETVRKFLALTKQHKENESKLESICLDDIALIPTIREAVDVHRKELAEQRQKQQDFLHQLGDLLLEVVTLKEEHTAVRTKQTKALNILKKQLDAHKKNQLQAHSDVINKVNSLDEKINCSISSSSFEQLASASPLLTKGLTSFGAPDPTTNTLQRGHIIWKVPDVMKKLTRVKTGNMDGTLVSPPFLTSEYGYKMNSWLYVNGRGKGVGQYLSLYVCVLVGDYDAILHWPVRPSYTLTLINQQSDSTRRQDYVKVRRVVDIAGRSGNVISQSRGIPRPSDCTKALIVGFDDFISHEELLNRRYLVDDTLFLKIEAEVGTV